MEYLSRLCYNYLLFYCLGLYKAVTKNYGSLKVLLMNKIINSISQLDLLIYTSCLKIEHYNFVSFKNSV